MPDQEFHGRRKLDEVELARVAGGAPPPDHPDVAPELGLLHVDHGDADATLTGGSGNDVLYMGQGDDSAAGGAGDDRIHGDNVFAAAAIGGDPAAVLTFSGNDTLDGGAGRDTIHGDSPSNAGLGGDDVISGGTGDGAADQAFGGAGDDTYIWRPGDGSDRFEGGTGQDTLHLPTLDEGTLRMCLDLPGGLELRSLGDGLFGFFDAAGNRTEASGSLTLKGETLSFAALETIRLG